jgi:predicted nucleotidyltransferase
MGRGMCEFLVQLPEERQPLTAISISYIHFLIDLGENLTPWFPVGLIHDLETLLGHKVDVVTEKSLHYFIRDRVLAEAKPL